MGLERVSTIGREWSVAGLGVLLIAGCGLQILRDGSVFIIDFIEIGLPIVVGIGLLVGGIRLRSTQETVHIAVWAVGGVLIGIGIHLWYTFLLSRAYTLTIDPVVLALNGVAIPTATGALLGYYVTALRQREAELDRSRSRFRALTENAPFAVLTIGGDGTIQYVNDGIFDVFGYSPETLIGEPATTLLPERLHDDHRSRLTHFTSTGDVADHSVLELTACRADGEEFPAEVSFGAYTDGDRELFTGVFQDISDRKEAKQELREHTSRITRLHTIATEITAVETKEAIYEQTVDGAAELFECDVARVLLARGDQLIPVASSSDESLDACNPVSALLSHAGGSYQSNQIVRIADLTDTRSTTASQPASTTNTATPGTDRGTRPDDEPVPRALLAIPLGEYGVLQLFATKTGAFSDRDEEVAEMFATHVVTALDRVAAEAKIRRERDRLDKFASVLSHDIRNPLTVAQGRLELVQDTDGVPDEEQFDVIERSLDRIERLIEDVLTLARQGDAVGAMEPVPLDGVARQAWNTVATEDASIRIDASTRLNADRSRLCQVFENLYRNAIEHAGDDITISVGQLEDGIYIEDTGPGIPADERERVFEHGHSTRADGTGYGLTIVKRIVEAHGWQIAVTEGTDGGARFEISGVHLATR